MNAKSRTRCQHCRALIRTDLGTTFNPLLPLTAVAALFFAPSVLLGMIVPMAVRVASTALASVGRVVGRLYALNALGSVAGALTATFLLAPVFGNRAILIGCGAALALTAVVCAALERGVRTAAPPPPATAVTPPARVRIAGLRALVFLCGMVFMSLEVIGGAQIAPFFGSSVFVWGSVITLFLLALSLGYRLGGRLADRWPTMRALAVIVAAAGLSTLVIPLITPAVCTLFSSDSLGGSLGRLRPLPAAVILYLVPTMLFAMVSPFAVRLATERVGKVGGVAGRLYALSTLGNVAGVLLTTFVLIATLGKTRVLELGGGLAVLAGLAMVIVHGRGWAAKRWVPATGVGLLLAIGLVIAPKPDLVALTSESERVLGSVAAAAGPPWALVESDRWDYNLDRYTTRHRLRRVRAERESPYHHIAVIEQAAAAEGSFAEGRFDKGVVTLDDGRRVRVSPFRDHTNRRDLRFDQYIESAVVLDARAEHIAKPYRAATTYSDMLHLPLLFAPDARDVLIIGGGGGVVPTTFRRSYPDLTIDVVEIDPAVMDVAQEWFGLTASDQLRLHVQDGRMFVHNATQLYDIILLDAYTAGGRIPFHLTTREFLDDVRRHLRPDGVVLMNVISPLGGPRNRLIRSEYKTFREVFGVEHVYVFPKLPELAETVQNIMLVATGSGHAQRLTPNEIVRRAQAATASGRIKMFSLPKHARKMLTVRELERVPLDDVPVLTDDYAPVDLMVPDHH